MFFEEAMGRFPNGLVRDLRQTPQSPKWHPEGVVYNHIKLVFDGVQKKRLSEDLEIAALFHDLGKIDTTEITPEGKITCHGHEHLCDKYIKEFSHLFPEAKCWERIHFVCKHHMKMHLIDTMRPFKKEELTSSRFWNDLVDFGKCDDEGRGE